MIRAAGEAAVLLVAEAERHERGLLELGREFPLRAVVELCERLGEPRDLERALAKVVRLLGVEKQNPMRDFRLRHHDGDDRSSRRAASSRRAGDSRSATSICRRPRAPRSPDRGSDPACRSRSRRARRASRRGRADRASARRGRSAARRELPVAIRADRDTSRAPIPPSASIAARQRSTAAGGDADGEPARVQPAGRGGAAAAFFFFVLVAPCSAKLAGADQRRQPARLAAVTRAGAVGPGKRIFLADALASPLPSPYRAMRLRSIVALFSPPAALRRRTEARHHRRRTISRSSSSPIRASRRTVRAWCTSCRESIARRIGECRPSGSRPTDGSAPARVLIDEAWSPSAPRWSPDGTAIEFISARASTDTGSAAARRARRRVPQLWIQSLSRRRAAQGDEHHERRLQLRAVAGRRARRCLSRTGPSDKRPAGKDRSDVRHYSHLVVQVQRYWLVRRPPVAHLDRRPRERRRAVRSPRATIGTTPIRSGRRTAARIAFVSDRTGHEYDGGRNTDVWTIGAERRRADESLGGRRAGQLAALVAGRKVDRVRDAAAEEAPPQIMIAPLGGGVTTAPFPALDLIPTDLQWSGDGRSLYFDTGVKGEYQLFRIEIAPIASRR